jgi:S-formylglutathione hydrolase FrmB
VGPGRFWVVIYSHKVGRFYPQNQPAEIQVRGQWYSRVYFGVPADSGQDFDVLAVVPDVDAQDELRAYLADNRDRPDAPGFEALPAGAVIYDRLTVTRKLDTVSLIRETATACCRGGHGTVGDHV